MEKGRISANELAEKLVSSRKIMKKVDTGEYTKGNINEEVLRSSPEELAGQNAPMVSNRRPVGAVDTHRVNNSNLPDAIKRAMIENPIQQISLNDGLDIELVNKARKLMEQDGTLSPRQSPNPVTKAPQQITESIPGNLEMIIENVIRKVLDEKLSQILNAQAGTNLNENLAIKVGDSIFTGKITKVKKS